MQSTFLSHIVRRGALVWLLVGFCLGGGGSPAYAEKPTLTRLFPPGGGRGQTVDVEAKGKFGTGEVRVWSHRPGLDWKRVEGANTFHVTVAADAEPGVTYVRIVDDGGASEVLPFLISDLPERNEEEPNNAVAEAKVVESTPIVINGVLGERGDVDGFRVTVPTGRTLVASATAQLGLASTGDATLQIVSIEGHVLAQNLDYHSLDPQIAWTASEDCDVVVRVFGFPASPDSTIALAGNENFLYRLTLTIGPFVEGVVPMAVRGAEATAGKLAGWNLSAEGAAVSLPAVTDADGFTFFRPGVPGVFRLPVVSTPLFSVPDSREAPDAVYPVIIPICITGRMESPNQVDMFEFDASQGTKWTLQVHSRRLGYPLDAVLEIQDASNGKQLARDDDAGGGFDPLLNWTAPADGRYRVNVSALDGIGGPNYLYRLGIEPEAAADFSLTVGSDLFVGKVGEPLEIPVQIVRLAGFAQPVEVFMPDVPEGLTVEVATSGPEGETSKEVKLKLTSSVPWNSPIRLMGRVLGQNGVSKPVIASGVFEEFWVTIQ